MAVEKWNETGKVWDEDHGLLDEQQIAQCARANEAEPFRAPVPTRIVSNGEYMPVPQTKKQKSVEERINELAETAAKKLGVSRRKFLTSAGGMAAAFVAMNEVFGPIFNVNADEIVDSDARAANAAPRDLFVFDDQMHFVRGNRSAAGLRALAQGPSSSPQFKSNPQNPEGKLDEHGQPWGVWNPALVGLPIEPASFHLVQFIKDIYLDSQVTVGLLSNVTPSIKARNVKEARSGELLTAAQTVAARNFVNEISGSTRMLAHGMLYMGKGNLDYIQEQTDENEPDSWKGYNISNSAKVDDDPNSLMRQWRHDDEEVAYPTFELIEKLYGQLKDKKPGFRNICVHKGLAPGPPDPLRGHPADLPKAARDWPNLNFITYHSCIQSGMFMFDALEEVRSGNLRGGVPDISWTTEYAQLVAPFPNVYAEIGTTWASTIVTFPTVAAHIMGQLMKFMGPDRILFGSDSVWYGAPQWQIEALWRFQIPEALQEKYGYPELTEADKRKILGLNSARLYGIQPGESEEAQKRTYKPVPKDYESRISTELKTLLEFPGYTADNMSRFKEAYAASEAEPSNTRYGWIRKTV
ncbi:MAG: amidohydrolase family protein [Planctomycetota bacterium]|nr:amidohydrolase family protein [Planctomycetota bacterium]